MSLPYKRLAAFLGLCCALSLVVYDSLPHFDESLIQLKRDHRSSQRNWNIFYGQNYVYYDGSFRYQKDLSEIGALIEPGGVVLTDLATGYYASAAMPVYVRNVHPHHGRTKSRNWVKMLDSRSACYLGLADKFSKFNEFLVAEKRASKSNNRAQLKYVLANKDVNNRNLRYDCLWNGRAGFMENIERLASLKYEGEFINLYEFNDELTPAAPESN